MNSVAAELMNSPEDPNIIFSQRRQSVFFQFSESFVGRLILDEAKYIAEELKAVEGLASPGGVTLNRYDGRHLQLNIDEGVVTLKGIERGIKLAQFDRLHFGFDHYEKTATITQDGHNAQRLTDHRHTGFLGGVHTKSTLEKMRIEDMQATYDLLHESAVQHRQIHA